MIVALLVLAASGLAIYVACEFFVNAIEWLGHRLALGQRAIGAVLAAFGTALPETAVTFVAVALPGTAAGKAIGVGATMGGPLALSTIAYAAVGCTLLLTRRHLPRDQAMRGELRRLGRDQLLFLMISAVKIVLGLVAFASKQWVALLFAGVYGLYAWGEATAPAAGIEAAISPLRFSPKAPVPRYGLILLQTGIALIVIFFASRLFIGQLELLGPSMGLPPQVMALLFSPIATELPETLNAIIWVRQGKLHLALANISGAMMIQTTVPTALSIFCTPWLLDHTVLWAAIATSIASVLLAASFTSGRISPRGLAAMTLIYILFVVGAGYTIFN